MLKSPVISMFEYSGNTDSEKSQKSPINCVTVAKDDGLYTRGLNVKWNMMCFKRGVWNLRLLFGHFGWENCVFAIGKHV